MTETRTGLYPGSFDPVTLGHLDVIARAAKVVDRLIIGVGVQSAKTPVFSLKERCALIEQEVADLDGWIDVAPFEGLLVDFAGKTGADMIVRGLRGASDFDYEYQMTGMNTTMAPDIETVFLMASPARQHISGTLVRQIARLGGDVTPFVPAAVAAALKDKLDTDQQDGSKG